MFAEVTAIFLNVVVPVVSLVCIGYLFGPRLQLDARTLSRVAYYVFVPAFVFHHISGTEIVMSRTGKAIIFIIGVHLLGALSGFLLARFLHCSKKKAAAFALIGAFGNVGNFGIPIIVFRLGESAVATATIYFVVINVVAFVIGVGAASWANGTGSTAVWSVFKTPAIFAVFPALAFPATNTEIPLMISRIIGLLSGAMVPVMLIAMGISLATSDRIRFASDVVTAMALRLILVPVIATALALLMGIDGIERKAGILQAGMPAAVLTWIIAMEHDLLPDFVFSVLFLSTVCSLFSLTAILFFV